MKQFINNPGFYIGQLHIAWYGLIMASSMALAVLLTYFLFCKCRSIKNSDLLICALYVLPLAVIGARFFYVVFNPNGIQYSFVDALKIWEGGMSIWGGVIGGFLGVLVFCLIHKRNLLSMCDVIAPALILSQAIGRWGNYINKEAYGWEVFDSRFFGLPFTVEVGGHYYLATFLFESVLNLIGFAVLVTLLYKTKKRGLVMSVYLMWYGVVRSIIEIFRTDPMMIGSVKFSQMMSIISACVGAGIFIYIFIRDAKLKKQDKKTATENVNNSQLKKQKQENRNKNKNNLQK
ncbi:MAG: prolipoprotein diacylglyceryl transferase [Christensenellales bacterium]